MKPKKSVPIKMRVKKPFQVIMFNDAFPVGSVVKAVVSNYYHDCFNIENAQGKQFAAVPKEYLEKV